jgi:SnoaL-like domain
VSARPAQQLAGTPPRAAAVQARLACSDLVTSFFELVDDGHAARTAELFTADAELILGKTFTGVASIRAAMQVRQDDAERKTAHVPAQSSFRLLGPDRAEGRTFVQVYRLDLDQSTPATYALSLLTDAFARGSDGRWRFARRELSVLAGGE